MIEFCGVLSIGIRATILGIPAVIPYCSQRCCLTLPHCRHFLAASSALTRLTAAPFFLPYHSPHCCLPLLLPHWHKAASPLLPHVATLAVAAHSFFLSSSTGSVTIAASPPHLLPLLTITTTPLATIASPAAAVHSFLYPTTP
ncbi:hypothetical protein GW17_00038465 [Ensete ventricosum]|nr:hypothetical protein GW17_00038465 [Ensete ventricosum]RZS03622.1 hypothetical protein BHM03_00033815 [Ensete ventricosum]